MNREMTAKRQINNQKFDVNLIVDEAFAAGETAINPDWARQQIARLGCTNPTDAQMVEYTMLNHMERATGAYFRGQFGRGTIDFSSREAAIAGVNSYLTRRNNGYRIRWNGR